MDTVSSTSTSSEGDSIKIFLRVRPPEPGISENDFAPRVLDVNTADNAVILRTKPEPKIFTYDNVADADITQEAVFCTVGKKIIESCIAGYNGTIFAYGQTGSGKTFTMLGPSENSDSFQHELRGVIPRSFEYLFNLIAHQQELHGSKKLFLCRCSFLEIYQEQIFDLLDSTSQGLHLRENMNKGVFVDGLIEQVICNPWDAYQVLIMGWLNRRVAATSMNRESSRSHAVFTVTIESKEDALGVQNIRTSQLNLVDLAGSERQRDTNTGGTRLKEAGSINKSLSILGNVIMSLVDLSHGKKRHIPYRDSKLTFLLRDSLGGNTKTRMIACVHPDSKCFGETLSTLNFARSAKLIKNKAVVNEDFHGNNQKLQNEIRRLRDLLGTMQNSPPEQSLSVTRKAGPEPNLNSDSVWKNYFVEAMYFRDVSEGEKKALQDVVNHLQELCIKKEKYIQSAKMIIKFRENNIQTLKQSSTTFTEHEKNSYLQSLQEELKVVRDQLEINPMLAKYAGENKYLRSELKQLRARVTLDKVNGDSAHIAELERVFKELKMYQELSNGCVSPNPGRRTSPFKDNSISVATLEKHRQEVKEYQEQIEVLKQQVLDINKVSENRQMELEVELVYCRKMILELERVLEAHQLKARIECNALKDLHCQTLKVMTTPKMSPGKCDSSCGEAGVGAIGETDLGDSEIIPKDLAEEAHDALMEEIRMLQFENGKFKENMDEYEAVMLRQKQQVEKLELYNKQLNGFLERERQECTSRKNDYTSAVNTLNEEIDTVKNDLKLLNDENTDLHLVLKSADKQLKEEKEKHKATKHALSQEIQALETKLSRSALSLENTTRDYEEALKELGALKEDLETSQVTNNFLQSHAQEMMDQFHQECRRREQMEQEIQGISASQELKSYIDFKQQAEDKQAQLITVLEERDEQERLLLQQKQQIADNKEAISNLMSTLHELKAKLGTAEENSVTLRIENENYCRELHDLKQDHEMVQGELSCVQRKRNDQEDRSELLLIKKDFEIDNLQQNQDSANAHLLRQEETITSLQAQLRTQETLCKEHESTQADYKNKLNESDRALQEAITHYQQSLREVTGCPDTRADMVKIVQEKNIEIESLHLSYKKLAMMLNGYEQARKEKNGDNEKLRSQVCELEKSKASLYDQVAKLEEQQISLDAHMANNIDLLKSMELSLKVKDEALIQDKVGLRKVVSRQTQLEIEQENLKEQLQASEWEKEHYQQEVNRLQSRMEVHHAETTALNSKLETLAEEKAKTTSELQQEHARNLQLMEESSRLIGHNNVHQKIRLLEKKNIEYNDLHKKYYELQEKYEKLMIESGKMTVNSTFKPGGSNVEKESLNTSQQAQGLREITNLSN